MSNAEVARRAVAVRALLEDENIQAAFAQIEEDLTSEWRRSHTTEERENIWRTISLIERLKTWMASAASHDLTAIRRQGVKINY